MSEKHAKILTLISKVSAVLTVISSKVDMIPEKYAWLGIVVFALASISKDMISWLGDLWDDGKLNNSFKK